MRVSQADNNTAVSHFFCQKYKKKTEYHVE